MIAPRVPAASLLDLVGMLGWAASLIEQQALGRAADPGDAAGRPSRADLLARFLSDDERAVLRALVELGPCRAADVAAAVKLRRVSKSAFWVVWRQLQVRNLIDQGRDGLFMPAAPWVADLVSG